jgi:hypothetical protein
MVLISSRFNDDQLGGQIVGEVKNIGTQAAEFVEALATFRDVSGAVIDVASTYTDILPVVSGSTSTFNLFINSDVVTNVGSTYDLTLKWEDEETNQFAKSVLGKQPLTAGSGGGNSGNGGGGGGGSNGKDLKPCLIITIDPPLDPNETLPFPIPVPPYPPCPPGLLPQDPIPPPYDNQTEPGGPDEQCLFDPSLPHCTPAPGEDCPAGFGTNDDGQCFPLGGCPEGYHSNEDDETGTCYPDSEPCPEGQVRSDEGNYCVVPEPEPIDCAEGSGVNPSTGQCEPVSSTPVIPGPGIAPEPPVVEDPDNPPPSEDGDNQGEDNEDGGEDDGDNVGDNDSGDESSDSGDEESGSSEE